MDDIVLLCRCRCLVVLLCCCSCLLSTISPNAASRNLRNRSFQFGISIEPEICCERRLFLGGLDSSPTCCGEARLPRLDSRLLLPSHAPCTATATPCTGTPMHSDSDHLEYTRRVYMLDPKCRLAQYATDFNQPLLGSLTGAGLSWLSQSRSRPPREPPLGCGQKEVGFQLYELMISEWRGAAPSRGAHALISSGDDYALPLSNKRR